MPTLAQHLDIDRLVQAIRQDPVPSHAANLAIEAVEAALQAYRAPSLEARRLAEEAAGAVKESLVVLSACILPAAPARRPPPPRPVPVQHFGPPAPQFDMVAYVPLACALAALPFQGWGIGSLFVLGAAAGSSVMILRTYRQSAPIIAPPPPAVPLRAEPPPPAATLHAETIAAAVQRALAQIDDLVAFAERRRAARTEPTTLNDTTLEFLQDLAEAVLRNRAEFALAKIEFRLPVVLEALDLQAVEYTPDTAANFDVDGDPVAAVTRRPALLAGARCVKRGLAATRPGRAA